MLTPEGIQGNLHQLTRGERPGRRGDQEITVFKAVGSALEDLTLATLVYESVRDSAATTTGENA
ncbi:ornithine cyclodeaminase [compost metagenome]